MRAVLQLYRDTKEDANLIDQGSLTFVVIGGGATGVEAAGALAELAHNVMPHVYENPALAQGRVVLVDLGHAVLAPFSDDVHEYAAKQLQRRGVELKLGVSAKEIGSDHVKLSDGTTIDTHLTVWGGDCRPRRSGRARAGPGERRTHRRPARPYGRGHPNVYALGDFANVPSGDDPALPQLGSVAQQSGDWAAKNILAVAGERARSPSSTRTRGSWR